MGTRRTLSAIVAGTGFEGRASQIRAFCRIGSEIQLRREPDNLHHPEAIAVWLRASILWGLWRPWFQIGYIRSVVANSWAPKIDSGRMVVLSARINSLYAPIDNEHPRVSLAVEVEDRDLDA